MPAEIYHLKAAGEQNWPKMDEVIAKMRRRERRGCTSRLTCTPIPPERQDSMPRCPHGFKKADFAHGSAG